LLPYFSHIRIIDNNQVMPQAWHGKDTEEMMNKFNSGEIPSSDDASINGTDSEDEAVINECSRSDNGGQKKKQYWWVDEFRGLVDKRGHPETCRTKPDTLVSLNPLHIPSTLRCILVYSCHG
jgi:hypothetical protein